MSLSHARTQQWGFRRCASTGSHPKTSRTLGYFEAMAPLTLRIVASAATSTVKLSERPPTGFELEIVSCTILQGWEREERDLKWPCELGAPTLLAFVAYTQLNTQRADYPNTRTHLSRNFMLASQSGKDIVYNICFLYILYKQRCLQEMSINFVAGWLVQLSANTSSILRHPQSQDSFRW